MKGSWYRGHGTGGRGGSPIVKVQGLEHRVQTESTDISPVYTGILIRIPIRT